MLVSFRRRLSWQRERFLMRTLLASLATFQSQWQALPAALAALRVTYQGGHDPLGGVELCRVRNVQVGIVGEIGDGEVDGETLEAWRCRWWPSGSCKKHRWGVRGCRRTAVKAVGGQRQWCLASYFSSPAVIMMGKSGTRGPRGTRCLLGASCPCVVLTGRHWLRHWLFVVTWNERERDMSWSSVRGRRGARGRQQERPCSPLT